MITNPLRHAFPWMTDEEEVWLRRECWRRAALGYEQAQMWRDAAECWAEYGDPSRAGELYAEAGDLGRAADALLDAGRYANALELYQAREAELPERELACAPLESPEGEQYLGAMTAAINCALANRQILTHLTRKAFAKVIPEATIETLFDVSHNTCKLETHRVDGKEQRVYVHRKGATRAFGPGHAGLPERYARVGQPVIIGGTMGTGSYVLVGVDEAQNQAFASASHGAGRAMSRTQALKKWRGEEVVKELKKRGILIRTHSFRGAAEEAPGAYKDVDLVAEATEKADLSKRVAYLVPKACVKG